MHPSVQDLEALLRGTMEAERLIEVSSHTETCAACARELAWLRAEQDLFAQRARGVPPSEVWAQIEAQIAERITRRESAPRGWRRLFGHSLHSQQVQWFAVAAAAVAICGVVLASPLSPLRHSRWFTSSPKKVEQALPAVADGSTDDEDDSEDSEEESSAHQVSASSKLSGAISVDVRTDSADLEIAAGSGTEAKLTVSDADVKAVRLVPPAAGQPNWQLDFDGSPTLASGHLRLLLPVGSKLHIQSASGDVRVSDLGGDAAITTASGEIQVKGGGALAIESVSGDVNLQNTVGKIDVKTTSGDLLVSGEIKNPLHYTSISGDLMMSGVCRVASCKVRAETVSGSVTIHKNSDNSLLAQLRTDTGELTGTDRLPVEMKRQPNHKTEWSTKLGGGLGLVELQSMSGDLVLP